MANEHRTEHTADHVHSSLGDKRNREIIRNIGPAAAVYRASCAVEGIVGPKPADEGG